jgi:PAS domain S-box-containing protein
VIHGRTGRLLATAIAVVLALLLRVALERQAMMLPPFITFYPVVFLAILLGGMWEGIIATALSALLVDYFLLPPVGQFAIHSTSDIVGLAIFCVSGVTVSIVAELVQRKRGKLEVNRFEEAFPIGRESGADGEQSSLNQTKFKASLRRTVMVPFMAALMIAGAALWAAYDLNASMKWVDQTDQVIGESRRLLKLTVDMETGERGYLVTGNDAFLQPFRESSKVVDSEYETLYSLVADNPAQQTRLNRLHESLLHWQGYANQMIALRRTGGAYADLKINLTGKGEVDEIREQIAEFQSVEEHFREERNRAARRDWRLVETVCILLGLGVGLGLAVFTFRRVEGIAETFEKSRRALEESERRWAITLGSIGDGVIATDRWGRITFLNPVAAELTGWRSEDASGLPIQEVFHIVNERTRVQAEDIVKRVLDEKRVVELANHTILLRKDGREIPIADSAAPIVEGGGAIVGVVLVFHDVTERRRAEEALRENRAKLEAALASMTDSVIITDAEGQFVEFNDAYAKFYRFKSKAECAKNFDDFTSIFEVFLPDGKAAPRDMYAIQRALRGEQATGVEYTLRRKDTGESWIGSLSFSPIRDADGKIKGTVITARDVTEAKRTEMRLRRFYETELFAILYWKIDGGVVDANSRFLEMTGYSREDLQAGLLNWSEITPPEYQALDEDARRQIRETGIHLPYEKEFIRKDGVRVWGLFSAAAYEDNRSEGVSFILDITERKRAEKALEASMQRERERAEELGVLFESVPVPVFIARDPDCRHLTGNRLAEEILRTPSGNELSMSAPEEARPRHFRTFKDGRELELDELPAQRSARGEPIKDFEFSLVFDDGEVRHTLGYGNPLLDSQGNPRGTVATMVDITERKRAEEELKRLNRTLKALSNSNQAILHATGELTFLKEVCQMITADCGHAMVWIGIAEKDENCSVRPVAYSGFEEGYLEGLGVTWDESERGRGPTGTAIRTGQPCVCRNMLVDPAFAPWRADAIKRGYASSLAVPLKEGNKAWGAITIYSSEPDAFSAGEINLLMELAGDVEFGIQTLTLRAAQARAEEALRQSEELLGLFVEHAPAALAMFDSNMRYLHASRRWRTDYNLGDRALLGVSHYDVFPEVPEQWREAHRRGLAGEVLRGESDEFTRADGTVQWVRWEVRPWRDAAGKVGGIVIFTDDVTKRKVAEAAVLRSEKLALQRQQLQALAKRLHQAREEERKTIARDLHDQLGQILTAIKFDVTWVMRHLPKSEDGVQKRLSGSIELINDGVKSVRKICSGLRPGILDDVGLAAAIEWQANEFTARTGVACHVSVPSSVLELDSDRATAIFRIFQECLTNVTRHAEAKAIHTSLYLKDEDLMLAVEDDGKGFRESDAGGSLGVLGMKERAAAWGGSVQVSSSPGNGTKVTVRIPAHTAGAEREDHEYSDRG